MIKQINRILKLVGLNLIRAKRKKIVVRAAKEPISDFGPRPPYSRYTAKELMNCLPNPGEVPLSKYQDDYEWKNIPDNPSCAVGKSAPCATVSNPGKTHYVGDDCPGGPRGEFTENGLKNTFIGPEAGVQIVAPSAVFIPVDIGADDHEITRTEHESKR